MDSATTALGERIAAPNCAAPRRSLATARRRDARPCRCRVSSAKLAPRACRIFLAFAAAALLAHSPASHAAGAAQVTIEVPKGKTKSVRLKNLPRGAVVSARVSASGRLGVALVSAAQLRARNPEALFRGALDRSLTFKVVVPESSDYYLILDNRRGTKAVKTRATIKAERGRAGSRPPKERPAQPGMLKETAASRAYAA